MIRKGIIGDWKTHFTADESGEWNRWQDTYRASQKNFPSEFTGQYQFWANLGILGKSGHFRQFWANLGILGNSGHSGQFWAFWAILGKSGQIWAFWAILGILGNSGQIRAFWATLVILPDSASSFHRLSSSVFNVCRCRSSRIGNTSSYLHYMMFQTTQTIYFL